ncbi:hypothetical protein C4D60_Mb11t22860 [Musa balbisiana]|uniref:protein-serine/threonine phosphatase n=1 Tax=Musa balbisiana TaxID=52838 RepID=A0A4S8J7S0_MUSBA|nr:hypothetical protein C4D60_Mb11t22860 [Musa balbisiana]
MLMTKSSMGAMEGPVLDDVIHRLLEGRHGGRQVQLSESEIRQLCIEAKHVFRAQPNLLDLHAPIKICECFKVFVDRNVKFLVVEDGYEFFANRRLVTLFSAPNYCGEFDNAGALLSIDKNLFCSFEILKPYDFMSTPGSSNALKTAPKKSETGKV